MRILLREEGSTGDRIAKTGLVIILVSGWLVASFGEIGLDVWPAIFAAIGFGLVAIWVAVKDSVFSRRDVRWLFIPAFTIILGWIDPLWSSPVQWDQADHLQTANRYLGRWDWEPFHQGMDFAFRPKIMSGLLAMEVGLTGSRYEVNVIPLVCLIACGWQVQALAERNNGPIGGILAAIVVLTLPTMIIFGRTVYLEALATGALVLTFRIALDVLNFEDSNNEGYVRLAIVASLVGAVKYPYLYLGFFLPLCSWILNRNRDLITIFVFYWCMVQLPFLISDLIDHGSPFASFEPQAMGMVNSMTSDVGTYDFGQAFSDLSDEIGVILVLCIFIASCLWIKQDLRRRLLPMLSTILPSLIIFSIVLDFGYPRYHLPWLSVLICITLNWIFSNLEPLVKGAEIKAEVIGSLLVMLLLTHHVTSVISDSLESREHNQNVVRYRESYLLEFMEIGDNLPDDAVLLAGFDITLGVRFGVPTYRFGPSDDPIHDSIEVVNATHVIIGGVASRFEWESDPLFALGAPIDPLASSSKEGVYATLWSVNSTRSNNHGAASLLNVNWSNGHNGDVFLASGGNYVSSPPNWKIIEVIDLNNRYSDGREGIDLIFGKGGGASLICGGVVCLQEFLVPEDTRYLVKVGLIDEK